MKEYFMKFWGTAMYLLSYPYDICLVILAALYVIVSFLLLIFRNLIGGLVIIGHGKNFEETLHFQNAFTWIGNIHDEINNL